MHDILLGQREKKEYSNSRVESKRPQHQLPTPKTMRPKMNIILPPSSNPVQYHAIVFSHHLHLPSRNVNAIQPLARIAHVFSPQFKSNVQTACALLKPIPLLRPVDRVTDVRTRQRKAKEDELEKEPRPAASAALFACHGAGLL
jgi:hypothetical protein